MTMYSNNPNEIPMFMLTWGDIRTANTGIFGVDEYRFNDSHFVRLSGKISFQSAGVASNFGYESLRGYYPEMAQYANRLIGNVAARYRFYSNDWDISASAGYGNRAPSVSEAYGFFLFNTFDAYDYLGNPDLKNESSVETRFSLSKKHRNFEAKADVSHFFFHSYIIGKPNADLYHMTIGAGGVKVYQNLPHASILNAGLSLKYQFADYFTWSGKASYARGKDNKNGNLPLISPLSYNTSLTFRSDHFTAEAAIAGAVRQTHFSPEYGEDETKDYLIANLSIGYAFKVNKVIFNLKSGVENLFDAYYSTYSDWNNIPRKGRNFFVNLGISFN
jgi:iron complex outermembrane receptor protein